MSKPIRKCCQTCEHWNRANAGYSLIGIFALCNERGTISFDGQCCKGWETESNPGLPGNV